MLKPFYNLRTADILKNVERYVPWSRTRTEWARIEKMIVSGLLLENAVELVALKPLYATLMAQYSEVCPIVDPIVQYSHMLLPTAMLTQ